MFRELGISFHYCKDGEPSYVSAEKFEAGLCSALSYVRIDSLGARAILY